MGNPASVKRKLKEKRRKKHEQRLGPGAYLPKEDREKLNAEIAKIDAAEKARRAERAKAKKSEKK